MNIFFKALYIFLLLSLVWLCGCINQADGENLGEVVNVADGDTFTLLYAGNRRVKVRMYGIDSPERKQAFGTAARNRLGQLMQGHRIRLDEKDQDRYGRTVAIAYTDEGLNLNEAMLREGYAWHYRQYDKNNFEWSMLEAEARSKKLGLWSNPRPKPPWEYRKAKRARNKKSEIRNQK